MAEYTLERLKQNLDKQYADLFPLSIMKEEMFIPICKEEDYILVGIVNASNRDRRNSILTMIILKTKLKPKVIPISQIQLNEIIDLYSEKNPSVLKQDAKEADDKKPQFQSKSVPSATKSKKRLGEILIEEKLITEEQLNIALGESKKIGTPIGSILVKLGYITLEQLRETLSQQQGLESVETKELTINPVVIRLLPEDFIKENKVVPISTDNKILIVGMVNPNDRKVLNDIVYLTGLSPSPLILTHIEYEKCIENFFKTKIDTEKLIEEISLEETDIEDNVNIWQKVEQEIQDDTTSVAKLASSLITEGIEQKASDIHIEPRMENYIVRYRIDGILTKVFDVPVKIESLLISRLKVISRMDITEHRKPQDGHLNIKFNEKFYDLRINTLPVGNKEKMVIRILRPDVQINATERKIELKGAAKEDIEKISLMTQTPNGIILTTGPTGSGKTTTLYSILNKANNDFVNITTIEDPVEMKINGINQVQVNPKADVTFESCLRAILRQDPDIIMIGEIRDFETLKAAVHAALTGHLVLSTIHTNSAASTISRMVDMGIDRYLIASTLTGIISQRLIRRLCPICREKYEPSDEELKLIVPNKDEYELFKGGKIYRPKGCRSCDETGYMGRIGIYEILPVTREIKKMINQGCMDLEIEEAAVSCGMKLLNNAGLDNVLEGQTCIDEYLRVLGATNYQ